MPSRFRRGRLCKIQKLEQIGWVRSRRKISLETLQMIHFSWEVYPKFFTNLLAISRLSRVLGRMGNVDTHFRSKTLFFYGNRL
jgi:hypothetical protein